MSGLVGWEGGRMSGWVDRIERSITMAFWTYWIQFSMGT